MLKAPRLLTVVVVLVVMARRSEAPWAMSFRFYVYFALFVVVLRVVYRILFGGGALEGDTIVLHLPEIPLPDAARGIQPSIQFDDAIERLAVLLPGQA